MMKRSIHPSRMLWLLCPVALGLLCAALRLWQLRSAFEGTFGLHIPRSPATMILTCVLVASVALLTLMAVRQPEKSPPRGHLHKLWRKSGMMAREDAVCLTLTVAAAFLSLAAAPMMFLQGRAVRQEYLMGIVSNNGLLLFLSVVTSVAGFAGLLLAGRDRFRGVVGGKGEAAVMLAAINGCLWLMESYRGHAADPVLWDYVPLMLAIISGMLFYMDCAGLTSGAFHPRRALWLAGMTVVLSLTAMVGSDEKGSILLLLSQTAAALAVLWRLPVNMEHPSVAEMPQSTEEESQEEDNYV